MDEELKEKLLPAVAAFSLTMVAYQFVRGFQTSLPSVMLGVLIAGAIGGATFGIMHYLQNR